LTEFLLIRHGHCNPLGQYVAGRSSGVHLSDKGKQEVMSLVSFIKDIKANAIFTSPLERTRETAEFIASQWNIDVTVRDELNEIDCGDWTGVSFKDLETDTNWNYYNAYRSITRIPNGEMMVEVEMRMSSVIEELRKLVSGTVILVSHGDPIKLALAHYGGIPIDFISRFEIDTASVSSITTSEYGTEIKYINKKFNHQG
jgi:probable phosphoglycerate mutase